jgi:predicted RNA-binding protein with PIN domain
MEELASQIGNNYMVKVATSDALVQLSSLRSGVLRLSARELKADVDAAHAEMKQYYGRLQ